MPHIAEEAGGGARVRAKHLVAKKPAEQQRSAELRTEPRVLWGKLPSWVFWGGVNKLEDQMGSPHTGHFL